MNGVLVAAVQLDSGEDEERNFARARELCLRARARGAEFVCLPENVLYEGPDTARRHPIEHWEERFAALARELGCPLAAGTLREPAGDRAHNTLLLFAGDGRTLARYRKIHLFDVDVPGGPRERESEAIAPGAPEPTAAEVPGLGTVGLSICYDLRFPELYRALAARGARILLVPASFALGTGKDHWITLLRARAIENTAYVIAPDQFGRKAHGRVKFGKSAIVDPWGTVLAQAREGEDVVLAEIDFDLLARVRRALPCLEHRRLS
ncbi:MAG: carbon-nitrogen hydrolase family protein [Planctomycetota bacterium]|nr:MAG: carbon-nitrogen hydrolase family protein [Planctomycetota bacterium]